MINYLLRLKILLQYNYIYYVFLIIALLFSFYKINLNYESIYNLDDNKIIGKVINIKEKDKRYTITIKAKENLIGYYNNDLNASLGDTVLLEGNLFKPINNTIPNTFNYKKYLNNNDIYYLMNIDNIKVIKENNNIFYKLKEALNKRISSFNRSKKYLSSFILGNKSYIDSEVYSDYIFNGTVHLFSISGTHINFISGIIFLFLNKLKIKTLSKYLIVSFILLLFGFLVNFSASVSRSLIFFNLIYLNKHYNFNISTKNILFITIFLLIMINPKIILNIGFQYSVMATYGLIISSKKKSGYFNKLLYSSFIAYLFCLPITLLNNYEINMLAPVNNLILIPLITFLVFPLSLLSVIFSFLEPFYFNVILLMELLNNLLANIKIFNIVIPKVNIYFYLVYYIFLIIYIYSINIKYLIISLVLILSFKLKPIIDQNTYVYFLDVGQGDSTLIYNNKEVILIDTGGVYNKTVSDNTILFMKSIGISKIDLLLLTHGDMDHIKDAPNIIKKLKVKNVMLNSNDINDLEKEVLKLKPNIISNYNSKLNFKIYNNYIGSDENESSIISKLRVNNNKILFLGDASKSLERKFYKDYNIKADIVKLGHHGSKTSSDYNFLKNIEAKEGIISSGRNNLYNHPSKETIDTLNDLNIKYYETKESGSILYIFGQHHYTIHTFNP